MPGIIKFVHGPVDIGEIMDSVSDDRAGGTAFFIGTTRNFSDEGGTERGVAHLFYEAYEPMALKLMNDLSASARNRWELIGVSVVHRLGRVDIGEASVVTAVSAAHRAGALEACRFLIDGVKKEVPIWKKEIFTGEGGVERWVGL